MPKAHTLQDVYNNIKSLSSMTSLKPEEYAEPGGYADIVAQMANIKATQMRKIFHYVKELRREFGKTEGNFNRAKVALIMPILAYAQGRGHLPKQFYDLLVLCFGSEKCKSAEDFESAANFLEAIMAYHKYYHPKD